MKILVVVPDSNIGGITSAAVNFCNELTRRGNQVILLDMSGRFLCAERLDTNVVRAFLKGKSQYWNLQADTLKKVKGLKKLKYAVWGIIKKITIRSGCWYKLIFNKYQGYGEFDVAVAFRQCDSCYSFVLNKVKAKRKMGFIHGELKYMGDISSWERHMLKFDKIAYVSNAVKMEFISVYPELQKNSCTIYNMFNKKQILTMAQEKNPIIFDNSIKNMVTIARIDNAFKRIDLIPEICRYLMKQTSTKFHWYIIGDGPDREAVQQKIDELHLENVVTLCGVKSNPYAILKEADFSVLLSKSEAYPMTVIESLILKKPIVVTNFASVVEMIENGKHGLIAEFSKEDLAEKILKMLDDEDVLLACTQFLSQYEFSNNKAYQQFLENIGD